MSQINIPFNGTDYPVDKSALSSATDALKTHLSTVMNGSGAVINLDGTSYNVDSTKLTNATNTFTSHLGTIGGNGSKVVIGGVEYGIDSAKIADTIAKLRTAFGGLYGTLAAGLYETGAIARWQAGDRDGASAMMKTPWEDLVASGAIVVSEGPKLPENLPEINEYGFYFGVEYFVVMQGATLGFTFNEDGSSIYNSPDGVMDSPAGLIVYSDHTIDMSALDFPVFKVSDDGTVISAEGLDLSLGEYAPPKGDIYLGVVNGETTLLEGELVIASENSITGIAQGAFSNQNSLTGIMMHNNITIIGPFAFSACSNLSNVIISSSVTEIGGSAFEECRNLRSIVIPNSVTSIGYSAFYNCSSLMTVTFAENSRLVTIGNNAFSKTSIAEIFIPVGVTEIAYAAFYHCESLTTVTFAENNKLVTIGYRAFNMCTSFTSFVVPDSVTSIEGFAFGGENMTSITILAETPPTLDTLSLSECINLTEIRVPASSVDAYKAAYNWSKYADIIVAI